MDLRRMRYLTNRLPMARFRLERAMAKATKCTPSLTGMPGGGAPSSQVERGVELLEVVRGEYDRLVDELSALRLELNPMIDKLDDPNERSVMRLRYIDGYGVDDIADGIGYCRRHIFRIIKHAESRIEDVIACHPPYVL